MLFTKITTDITVAQDRLFYFLSSLKFLFREYEVNLLCSASDEDWLHGRTVRLSKIKPYKQTTKFNVYDEFMHLHFSNYNNHATICELQWLRQIGKMTLKIEKYVRSSIKNKAFLLCSWQKLMTFDSVCYPVIIELIILFFWTYHHFASRHEHMSRQ